MSMRCPKCGKKGVVVDSRPKRDGTVTRRYRCSAKCSSTRWSTIEMFVHYGPRKGLNLKETIGREFDKNSKSILISKLNELLT